METLIYSRSVEMYSQRIENIKHIVTTSSFCFIFRSKDYTEFKTFPQCNPVVADNYDVLSNTAIGMY
jgi:hypothetical protein